MNIGDTMGKHTMLLNWCNPDRCFLYTDSSSYDYRAIELLRPVSVFVIYENFNGESGGSGSHKLHVMLSSIISGKSAESSKLGQDEINDIERLASEYKLIYLCKSFGKGICGMVEYRICWIERKDRPIIFVPPILNDLPSIKQAVIVNK